MIRRMPLRSAKTLVERRASSPRVAYAALAAFLVSLPTLVGVTSAADLSEAVIRQKVNDVSVAINLTSEAKAASQGSTVHNENVVRTGTDSRAELEFTDLSLARVGANSLFSFDAKARAMNFQQGAVLFSKPTKSGPVELRAGAITAAITGSTGFISNRSGEAMAKSRSGNSPAKGTIIAGMLEGKLIGKARWVDSRGREHFTSFRLGPGDLIVAEPGRPPRTMQFDLPKYLRTSPLITGFSRPLPNATELNQAVADYIADDERGFVARRGVAGQVAWVGYGSLEAGTNRLNLSSNNGFENVGGSGIIRGQLIWTSSGDLDLRLTLPDGQVVSFLNKTVTFNNGRGIAMLDHDNLGNQIDVPPNIRVENIFVKGTLQPGKYIFVASNFGSSNPTDFTLRVASPGQTQVISGTLAPGGSSSPVIADIPPGP